MTVFPQIHIFQASQWRAWAEILKIGLPVSIQSMFFSGLSMILARLVAGWGDAAIAAQKVGSQIESISYTTAEGCHGGQRIYRTKLRRGPGGTASVMG